MRAKTSANDLVPGLLSSKIIFSRSKSDLSLDCFTKSAFFAKNQTPSWGWQDRPQPQVNWNFWATRPQPQPQPQRNLNQPQIKLIWGVIELIFRSEIVFNSIYIGYNLSFTTPTCRVHVLQEYFCHKRIFNLEKQCSVHVFMDFETISLLVCYR